MPYPTRNLDYGNGVNPDPAGDGIPDVLQAALASQYGPAALGRTPGPLTAVTITAEGASPTVLDYFGGNVYGYIGAVIHRSSDDGATWSSLATVDAGTGGVVAIRPTGDGEVLVGRTGSIVKSTGWTANPATATWAEVLDVSPGASTAYLIAWGFDGYEDKWIVTHYAAVPWDDSRYVWISTDSGDTWTEVYDTGSDATSHNHAACYDRWADRFLFSIGHHATNVGIYYSDNDGVDWARIVGSEDVTPAPTVIVATDNGLVCGTDSDPGGIYGIERRTDPTDMRMRFLWKWAPGRDGLVGFAQRGFRDENTGIVYIGYCSSFSDAATVVGAGDAVTADEIWRDTEQGASSRMWNAIVTDSGKFIGDYTDAAGAANVFEAWVTKPGATMLDSGNAFGGNADDGSSVAIGADATSEGTTSVTIGARASQTGSGTSVVIGHSASAVSGSHVVIGKDAASTATSTGNVLIGTSATMGTAATLAVAIGSSATVNAAGGVAIGYTASGNTNAVAVGRGATNTATTSVAVGFSATSGSGGVAIGPSTTASGVNSLALGINAAATTTRTISIGDASDATATWGIAIGYLAQATHQGSVALGQSRNTTATEQLQLGTGHVEMAEITAPAAPAANAGRLFIQDNGGGKTQLCVRFATGAVQILATEP